MRRSQPRPCAWHRLKPWTPTNVESKGWRRWEGRCFNGWQGIQWLTGFTISYNWWSLSRKSLEGVQLEGHQISTMMVVTLTWWWMLVNGSEAASWLIPCWKLGGKLLGCNHPQTTNDGSISPGWCRSVIVEGWFMQVNVWQWINGPFNRDWVMGRWMMRSILSCWMGQCDTEFASDQMWSVLQLHNM